MLILAALNPYEISSSKVYAVIITEGGIGRIHFTERVAREAGLEASSLPCYDNTAASDQSFLVQTCRVASVDKELNVVETFIAHIS